MQILQQHPHWQALIAVDKRLRQAGHESLLAGGAVRDVLLGREAKDLDLATSATPDQVEALFAKTILVGKAFGVVRVVHEGVEIEVATFRQDGHYLDGRRPEQVSFASAKEDALRRDFTINALFLDLQSGAIIDYVEGQSDLKNKIIRTVGDPEQRFAEDKLRILRALRFEAQLGFKMDEGTRQAIRTHHQQLHQVSVERLREEWEKLLAGPNLIPVVQWVFSEPLAQTLFQGWRTPDKGALSLFLDPHLSADARWCLWFALQKTWRLEQLEQELAKWKFSVLTQKRIRRCVQALTLYPELCKGEAVDWALELAEAEGLFVLPLVESLLGKELPANWLTQKQRALSFFTSGSLPSPLVTGQDLIQRGLKPGPDFQKILRQAFRTQLLNPNWDAEQLLSRTTSTG